MTAEKQRYSLNLSQSEIFLGEQAYPGSARNTISVRLYLPAHEPETVKEAADTVLDSADIFAVSFCGSESEAGLSYGTHKVSECRIIKQRSGDLAEDFMDDCDRRPLEMEKELYEALVIPLAGGGAYLYVRFHHIIIDGYGMSLFVQRVLDVLSGREVPQSVFAGNTGTQQETEGGFAAEEEGRFWRSYFSDAVFEPSVFLQKAARASYGRYSTALPEEIVEAAGHFGKREGIPVSAVFAAAFAFYLAQATGRKDAVFLMPRLNRTVEQRQILGCYTLLVPVRVTVHQEDTFAKLCRDTKAAADKAAAHKGCGFDRILSFLWAENLAADSISEYIFNYYRFRFQAEFPYSVCFSVAGQMSNHLTFNLFWNENGGIALNPDYHKGIYSAEKAGYFCDAIIKILAQGILSEGLGSRKLSDIHMLGEAEYQKVLSVTGKQIPIDQGLTIPSLFGRAVQKYKEKPAVYAGEHMLTFGQLDELTDRIACGLRRLGVKRGDGVTFLLKRDQRLIPVILGISKAGAVFIPVDPAYPPERISYIMENSQAALLVSSKNVEIAQNFDYVEADELFGMETEPELLPEIRQDDTAYMIYTSGTTGRPKGVMLSHKGIANIVHPDNNPFNRDITKNGHGITAIGSICFDISLFEIFVPLMNGLFVELGSEKAMTDAAELARYILRHHADILHCTPSRLLAYLENAAFLEALSSIRVVLAAGEVLPGSLVKRLDTQYHIRVYNGYGPTETTIGAAITEAGDAVSIGRPIANMGIVLFNQHGQPVPFGAVGEICIYGNGVGIGYKNMPRETEQKYIQWKDKRIYRTGDLGYFLDDGRLIYCGRFDRQIKLRGLRIELSEIESVMGEYPGIASCSCMVRKIGKTDRLIGFYTVSAGQSVDTGKLKEHMKAALAPYMVPDVWKELDDMPQTPNGKTDVKALAAVPVTYERLYRKPETEQEQIICSVFEKVLSVEQIGLDDNFFELGGDSLSAASAVLSIEEGLELMENELEYGDLYQYPTPYLLARKIIKQAQGDGLQETGFDIHSLDYDGFREYLDGHVKRGAGQRHLGNVLLTGVTGYLGCHIFADLMKRPKICGRVICLSRPKKKRTALMRIKSALFYYAEEDFSESYGDKWLVAEGDITNPQIFTGSGQTAAAGPADINGEQLERIPIQTIINCAADVSHFSYGSGLEEINTDGVKNLIRFAQRKHALLCQISTISVAGLTASDAEQRSFRERDFYIGQEIDNKYIYSKYMAEYEMLRAAADGRLPIKIMRVGNLQGRIRDGEFQMNLNSNAFTRRFSAYVKLGAVPASVYHGFVNFSPVDETAHNIVSLAASGEEAAVFHVYPPAELKFSSLFQGVQKLGYPVEILPDEEFFELIKKKKRTKEGRAQMEGLVTNEYSKKRCEIPVNQDFTEQYLKELSEGWSEITDEYISKYLSALQGLDLFDME